MKAQFRSRAEYRTNWITGIVAGVGLGLATIAGAGADTRGWVEHYCASLGVSYSTQVYCIKKELAAAERLERRVRSFVGVAPEILQYCGSLGLSYSTMEYCITKEEAAKRQLGR